MRAIAKTINKRCGYNLATKIGVYIKMHITK
jgi:hypothetical protein